MHLKPGSIRDSVEMGVINCLVMERTPEQLDPEELRERVVDILTDPECSSRVFDHARRKVRSLEERADRLRQAVDTATLQREESKVGRRSRYVVGFIFDHGLDFVRLLRKTHPEWQRGKLNGVGGHVEGHETFDEAMVREGYEETGVELSWYKFAVLHGPDWDMGCFYATAWMPDFPSEFNDVGEKFEVRPIFQVVAGEKTEEVIPNLRWLIPLALAARVDNGAHTVIIHRSLEERKRERGAALREGA